jgi:hypothetical protein
MPENSVRFAVTDDRNNRSGTWKCWARTGTGAHDVYLACRELAAFLKVSLHQSGDWRIAWNSGVLEQHLEELPTDGVDRVIHRWSRPQEMAPGITFALRIVVPASAVSVPIEQPLAKGTVRIPTPSSGKVVDVSFFLTGPKAKVTNWPGKRAMGTSLVGTLDLDNGERVWIVYRVDEMPQFASQQVQMTKFKRATAVDWSSPGLRTIAVSHEQGGVPWIVEARVLGPTQGLPTTDSDDP